MAPKIARRAMLIDVKPLPAGVPARLGEIWVFLRMKVLANGPDIDVYSFRQALAEAFGTVEQRRNLTDGQGHHQSQGCC